MEMYLRWSSLHVIFTRMPSNGYRRWFRSPLFCTLLHVWRVLSPLTSLCLSIQWHRSLSKFHHTNDNHLGGGRWQSIAFEMAKQSATKINCDLATTLDVSLTSICSNPFLQNGCKRNLYLNTTTMIPMISWRISPFTQPSNVNLLTTTNETMKQ